MHSLSISALALAFTLAPLAHAEVATPTETKAPAPAVSPVQNVTPDEAQKLLQEKKEIVILDVRTPEEFQEGHIAGAQNLNLMSPDFKQKLAELDKSKEYVVHCQAGGRSARAVKQMEAAGFTKVDHLNGGMSAWQGAGKPVQK